MSRDTGDVSPETYVVNPDTVAPVSRCASDRDNLRQIAAIQAQTLTTSGQAQAPDRDTTRRRGADRDEKR
jgi:hypothetical protein